MRRRGSFEILLVLIGDFCARLGITSFDVRVYFGFASVRIPIFSVRVCTMSERLVYRINLSVERLQIFEKAFSVPFT